MVSLYQKKSFINKIGRSERHDQKRHPTKSVVISPDPLSPTASNTSAKTAPEHTDKDTDNPEPAGKLDIHI